MRLFTALSLILCVVLVSESSAKGHKKHHRKHHKRTAFHSGFHHRYYAINQVEADSMAKDLV